MYGGPATGDDRMSAAVVAFDCSGRLYYNRVDRTRKRSLRWGRKLGDKERSGAGGKSYDLNTDGR